MNKFKFGLIALLSVILISCHEDNDDNIDPSQPSTVVIDEIKDFVWKGMNAVYLYKDEIPDLANDRFSTNQQYADYLDGFATPETLFESLLYQPEIVDRFSFITDDYIALEQSFSGTRLDNGLRYYSFALPSNPNQLGLAIRQVIKDSPGDQQNLTRGTYITQIDGTTITSANVGSLLSSDTYTLHLADYDDNGTTSTSDDTFVANGTTVTLTKIEFTTNPVQITNIIDVDGEKLGYLFYNAFTADFNSQLNEAFGVFKSNNVQHLVIDLRYNGGGSVNSARLLGSMITGDFTGQTFSKLVYNRGLQYKTSTFQFVNSFNDQAVNSLNLKKVYVLTSSGTASASELIINSLEPYIDVVQIGLTTVGKTQASITIYDSENLGRENANPAHTYAMQPLVANSINVNDVAVPGTGLTPDIEIGEAILTLGTLGDPNEPFLAEAINDIRGLGRKSLIEGKENNIPIDKLLRIDRFEQELYIDQELIPSTLFNNQ